LVCQGNRHTDRGRRSVIQWWTPVHIEDDIFRVLAEENNVLYVDHSGDVCTLGDEVLCTAGLSYVPLTSIHVHSWTILHSSLTMVHQYVSRGQRI